MSPYHIGSPHNQPMVPHTTLAHEPDPVVSSCKLYSEFRLWHMWVAAWLFHRSKSGIIT